jgi:chromate transporter
MASARAPVGLATIAREWTRIGCIGFGGPPAHIALLRKLCVEQRGWLSAAEFEDGIAVTNLLPGPASTQLAIFCAWRLAGPVGALVGGAGFILPGLLVILGLANLVLAEHPPLWVAGAAAGAGAAVPAVAVAAAIGLIPASWRRAASNERNASRSRWPRRRWIGYLLAGGVAAALAGTFLVLVLAACGVTELLVRRSHGQGGGSGPARRNSERGGPGPAGGTGAGGGSGPAGGTGQGGGSAPAGGTGSGGGNDTGTSGQGRIGALLPILLAAPAATGGLLAVAWVAFKVGALSYGGGFVIIPLMQGDAVHTYHWMSGGQFLSAVALGQVTPGPVVQTVAVVGFAAAGIGGGLLASLVAFTPSFAFVLSGAPHFSALRRNARVQAFLIGAGPAAIGAIAGSAISLGLELSQLWQVAVLGLAAIWLLALRKNVVAAIVGAAGLGVIAVLVGAPLP